MGAGSRSVYRGGELARVLDPASVAIVGATPKPTAAGARALGQLEKLKFGGRIDLVNARYEAIADRPCYPSVSALPEAPDSVIITVPRAGVEEVVLDAAAAGARSAIIFAAGYSEVGQAERRREQDRLSAIARETGIRILGPNCLGAVNYWSGAALTYTNVPLPEGGIEAARAHDRPIGLVSQSGGLGFAAAQAIQRGVVFSHLLTSGNSCDVDVADLVAFLAEDPHCGAIACVFEAMPNPERLLEAAAIAMDAGKPIVINKLGTGEQGAAAAMTHSGMLAGSHDVYVELFRSAGMTLVDNFEELIETATYFAKARREVPAGTVVLASSGGASVMAADKAEIHDVPLPQPSEKTRAEIQRQLPDFGTARNPCDVTGGVANDLDTFFACVDLLLAEPCYGQLVTAHPYSVHTANRVRRFGELGEKHGKLICHVWITEYLAGPGLIEAESSAGSAVFRSMNRCFATIGLYQQWEARRARWLSEPRGAASHLEPAEAAGRAAALIEAAPAAALTEREAKAVLAEYGVPVIGEALVRNAEEAAAAAARFGGKVALKVESPDILHKTEAGVIRLGVSGEEAVRAAYREIMVAAAKLDPAPRINGVLVQAMAPAGVEIIVGGRIDPLFGPMVIVGSGGILVELLNDKVLALAPVGREQALEMIARLKGAALLDGFRGGAAADRGALADAICRISELVADQAARLAEIDINPLICSADSIVAVDALIVKAAAAQPAEEPAPEMVVAY
ncbi:acetate--CoA ligase family protein [Sphingosinicella terrae]|uniref:acetate--CoA ligase family protein n=1 Tax=Sphingosinicella terrae TaxID=2172047 RepID=UPI0013B3CD73|nr:acetate--CoA ligase family protein [Sphingosinicella terrae]